MEKQVKIGMGEPRNAGTVIARGSYEGLGEAMYVSLLSLIKERCCTLTEQGKSIDKPEAWDFPGGTVVKNPPANAGDTGSSPGPGRSHMPQSN